MQIELKGLLRETTKAGTVFYRVRVEGKKAKRIRLTITPEHPDFMEHYHAARRGISMVVTDPIDAALPKSLSWLTLKFEAYIADQVEAGQLDPKTLTQRRSFYRRLRAAHGEKHMLMPPHALQLMVDDMSDTPGAARNLVKSLRALYRWGQERGHVASNPAAGIKLPPEGKGAVPWSLDDLKQYRETHPKGTMAHLTLSLFMFTGGRISDVYQMGRDNEVMRAGVPSRPDQNAGQERRKCTSACANHPRRGRVRGRSCWYPPALQTH